MCHTYAKKFCSPSIVISLSTFVLGLITFTVWVNLGMVSKNFSTFLNCTEFSDSIKSFNSFFEQSSDAQLSSSEKTWSTHDEIKSNVIVFGNFNFNVIDAEIGLAFKSFDLSFVRQNILNENYYYNDSIYIDYSNQSTIYHFLHSKN